jgi:ketosteroid isomerase-like protein
MAWVHLGYSINIHLWLPVIQTVSPNAATIADCLTPCCRRGTIRHPSPALEALMDGPEDDVALVRRWFQRLQLCVQTVDFVGSRPLFAEDLITFGTYTAFTTGRDATETEQWRHVWGEIDQFRWRLDDLRTIISGDRLTAVAMAVFDSTGYTEDGKPFDRPGRATVVLGRRAVGNEWVAQHTHVSLFPGTSTRSFGSKKERPPAL